jgi:Cu/Ag efflux pump CusA
MVHRIIEWSLKNRFIVLVLAIGPFMWGFFAVKRNPIDAIPDLSENPYFGEKMMTCGEVKETIK